MLFRSLRTFDVFDESLNLGFVVFDILMFCLLLFQSLSLHF